MNSCPDLYIVLLLEFEASRKNLSSLLLRPRLHSINVSLCSSFQYLLAGKYVNWRILSFLSFHIGYIDVFPLSVFYVYSKLLGIILKVFWIAQVSSFPFSDRYSVV
jgi:hypothetical protein